MLKLPPSPRAAFMLIELAVASMIIGFALLALLGLGHVAERAATEAEGELRATLFADEVFTTLRIYSDHFSSSTNYTDWTGFWIDMQQGLLEIPIAPLSTDLMLPPDRSGSERLIKGGYQENTVVWKSRASELTSSVPDYALRYRLTIGPRGGGSRNDGRISDNETMVLATLHIWPGASRTGTPPLNFFTSFSHSGGLP